MEFVPMVLLSSLVLSFINFLKYVKAKDMNGWFTQLAVWIAGVGGVMLAAQTDFANMFTFGGFTLDGLNAWSQAFLGMTVGAGATTLVEFKKAIDGADSAAKPNLINDK